MAWLRSKSMRKKRKRNSYLDVNQRRDLDDFLSQFDVIDESVKRAALRFHNGIYVNRQIDFAVIDNYCENYKRRVQDANF